MKRIFVNYPVPDSVPECFRMDYYETVRLFMEKDEYDFLHSKGYQIEITSNRKINKIPIPGWDLGNGNILSLPSKICECCQICFEDIIIVTFTYVKPNQSGIAISIVRLNSIEFSLCEKNAFDSAVQIFQYDCGFNSNISIDDNVICWRTYSTDSPNSDYQIHNFDLTTSEHIIFDKDNDLHEYKCFEWRSNTNVVCHKINNLQSLILFPNYESGKSMPAVVICPGGPHSEIPQYGKMPKIVNWFLKEGFIVIYPLRRGICGMGKEWKNSLVGNYGIADVNDIMISTKSILQSGRYNIDTTKVGLYGGSYGGYNALLIAGKHNQDRLFRAVCSHCGVYDLASYPYECFGTPESIMKTYGNTTNEILYRKRISSINPASYVKYWNAPTLLIHTLSDTSTWYGQSIKAYNDSLKSKKECTLILAPGSHSYAIPNGDKLILKITEFIKNNMS